MEGKNKDQKLPSATTQQPHSNHLPPIKEEKDQTNGAIAAKSVGAISPSNHNAPALNQQSLPVSQTYTEQPAPNSNPCASSQLPQPTSVNQLPHFALNPASQQHGYPLPNQPQSFWMPHQHPGVNAPPSFHSVVPPGTVNANWQPSPLVGSGTSLNGHTQVPNQVGYTYPACPGPWDPSSWWGQAHVSRPPMAYAFPGSYSQVSMHHPAMPPCSTPSGRGIIKPSAKLSQKHQQLWEAQSAENVKLWTVIDQLQLEIATFKSRVVKLEVEVASLKQATGEPTTRVTSTAVSEQAAKKRRQRRSAALVNARSAALVNSRSAALVNALPSLDEFHPSTQGRESKTPIFEKVVLPKAENNMKPVHLVALAQQAKEKDSNLMTREGKGLNGSVINGNNARIPSFHTQVHKENSMMQMGGGVDRNSLEMKNNNGKIADTNDAIAFAALLAQQTKGMDHRTALASCHAARDNQIVGWPYAILPQDNGKNLANMNPQRFYNNSNGTEQGEKVNGGSGVANEEDAKDDNDEEMEDDESSSGEEIGC